MFYLGRFEDRLSHWAKFRLTLESSDTPFLDVLAYYDKAPRVSINTDPWNQKVWPGPWELINENSKSLIPKFIASNKIVDEQISIPTKEKIHLHKIKTDSQLEKNQKISFLDRCYLFIKKNWWITPSLTIIIFLLLILGF